MWETVKVTGHLVMHHIPFPDLHYFSMFQVVSVNTVERYGTVILFDRFPFLNNGVISVIFIKEEKLDELIPLFNSVERIFEKISRFILNLDSHLPKKFVLFTSM